MRGIIKPISMAALVFVGLSVGGLLLRNYQMDGGVKALKEERGRAALSRLKPLAILGDKSAQVLVGTIYAYGLGGAPKSDQDAIYWFRRSGPVGKYRVEDNTDPAAPFELDVAKAYATGEQGVKADPAESAKWLKLAAKGGSKEAAALLAQSSSSR